MNYKEKILHTKKQRIYNFVSTTEENRADKVSILINN